MRWSPKKERRKTWPSWVKSCSRCGAESDSVRFREQSGVCVSCQNYDRRRNLGERLKIRLPLGVGAHGLVGDESPETDRAIQQIRRITADHMPAIRKAKPCPDSSSPPLRRSASSDAIATSNPSSPTP